MIDISTVQLTEVTLENLQKNEEVTINFGAYKAIFNLENDKTFTVYLLNTDTQETVKEKWYSATESSLTTALNDLRAHSKENVERTLSKNYNFHVMYSVDNGSKVDSIGCNSPEQANEVSEHMLYALKACHNEIEYLKVIDNEGKLLFDLDVEQENIMHIN